MAFENLPGVTEQRVDGNLGQVAPNTNPAVVVIGTAAKGASETLVSVARTGQSAKTFGREGTLTRGMYEAASSGALNIQLFRILATSARLTLVGGGITIETASKDNSAGTDYSLFWDDTAGRLRVYRVSDDTLVYDNDPTYPDNVLDLGEVYVSGTQVGNPGDIGTLVAPITLAAADGVNGAVYATGTDGLRPSRMKLWEGFYKAYKLLDNADLDFVAPMNAYLDDANVQDMTTAGVAAANTAAAPWDAGANTYPTAGDTLHDFLGKVFVQEYNGEYHFWWDTDRDNVAEIWPAGIGSATSTTDADGNGLSGSDFHEVNFAYDLARFCFEKSEDNDEVLGFIGVKPPASFSLQDVSNWAGKAPVSADDFDGDAIISTNGTGLLGNKFMAGRLGNVGSGLPSFSIDGKDGMLHGGFIATDSVWLDEGTQLKDANDKLVDLGKYISVVGAQAILSNNFSDNSYVTTGAIGYAGFVASLPANSAPTNKIMPAVRLPFRLGLPKLDALSAAGYVMFHQKAKGNVVTDAPTASRPGSDYRRLTTVRIVKDVLDAIRLVADPFLGEALTDARLAALDTAIDQVLIKLQKAAYLNRYDKQLTSAPADRVLGRAKLDLVLVPAFELRQLNITLSLAAQ